MSTFRYGKYTTVPNGTTVPSNNDGLDNNVLPGRDLKEWALKLTFVATGAFSTNVVCWRKDTENDWGTFGFASGDVNMGTAFSAASAGTYVFETNGDFFLGLPSRLYFRPSNLTNITLTTKISPIVKD